MDSLTATQASPQGSRQFTFVRFACVKVHREVQQGVLLSSNQAPLLPPR